MHVSKLSLALNSAPFLEEVKRANLKYAFIFFEPLLQIALSIFYIGNVHRSRLLDMKFERTPIECLGDVWP